MLRHKLTDILLDYIERPMQAPYRRERLQRVARLACETFPGDLVEIGAHVGKTTIKLLEVAKEYDRRVLVIDPWLKGTQNCKGGERAKFDERVEPLNQGLDIVTAASQSKDSIAAIKGREIAFALVDGLHTYEACYCDIQNVKHSGIICVDDVLQMGDVRAAFEDGAHNLKRELIEFYDQGFREGYII
jgi:predicted O-methyltransferase YrrM